jgi:sporulation protein YlmC with PRC-barrel domain
MKLDRPRELVGKEVFDTNGHVIGTIDKMWNSWNQEYPGPFFGIKPNEHARYRCFRGTYRLIPIHSGFIGEISEHVTLCKTMDDLCRSWNKTVQCGPTTCPADELLDKPVYDKNYSRVGTFLASVDSDGPSKNYGILIDPYLFDIWKAPYNTLMPIPTNYINNIKETITLDKTLDELKEYWKQHFNF